MITAHALSKRYGERTAVDDLSFEAAPGMVTGFLGPNGAGKSTTMRLMLDLDHGGGETRFGGRRFGTIRHPMWEIGAVLEARAFHPTRTARNHLRMLAAGSGIPYARADEVLDFVGLAEVAGGRPRGFSLGMAQRLGLAQALLGDPGTLILDEPANGLDPHGIHWLRDTLRSLAAEGRTVFVSSHLLSEMELMADRLVVIGRGRLIYAGDVAGFVREFTRSTVIVRSPGAAKLAGLIAGSELGDDDSLRITDRAAAEVGEIAFRAGIPLHELTTVTASLEAAFMTATGGAEEFVGVPA
ncbi:ATP-binding cassette domain-containing protein [Actinoplanes sp. NPDC051411]|uniref:ATP-binding cassette domain-containing protein n=1 Tax=Actinoplanes sp. NPDC051411 TaxID=3155522 RepID=UPI00341CB5EC